MTPAEFTSRKEEIIICLYHVLFKESGFFNCREQMIIFVYDTSFCQTEEDDPQKAVLFFHPKWVSDQQRLSLCGQLMGAAHFCSTVFSAPQVLTLQSGKFILRRYNQFILSVGSDQTLPDWMLNERFRILQSLLEFYHKSFDTILANVNSEYESFTRKLCDIFEIYSPLIEYIVSTYGNIPTIKFPRKKSTMFLEAFQLLESCCAFQGVLGGTILHSSRVIGTLLDSDVTKVLALTDPHRVRCGAEQIKTPFHLPLGVQLIRVYVKHAAYESVGNLRIAKPAFSNGITKQEKVPQGSEMKQELTKIFTVLEEEDGNINSGGQKKTQGLQLRELTRKRNKKYCKSKTENNLRERSRNFVVNHNIKVCSTPTVEKKFVHEDLVSICSNPKVDPKPNPPSSFTFMPDLMLATIKPKQVNKFLPSRYTYNYLHRISMDDLMIDFSYKSYPIPLRYYSFGLPKICKEVDQSTKDEENSKKLYKNRFFKTIADPSNPVFRYDGLPVSKSLYNHCLDQHYKDFIAANITIDSREEFIRRKNLENELFKSKTERVVKATESNVDPDNGMRVSNEREYSINNNIGKAEISASEEKESNSAKQKLFRRSLTLPLKPLSYVGSESNVPMTQMSVVKSKVLHSRTPTTPLMTKLSLLVLEEQNDSTSFGSVVQQCQAKSKLINDNVIKKQPTVVEDGNSDTTNCTLFVCGQANFTLLLLLEENAEQNPDLILSLWELCTTNLDKIELLRNKSIDHISSGAVSGSYSFLSLDPQWGTMQKSGVWGNDEMKVVGSLHQDLIQTPNITEIIVRNEDAVIYGYRCGNTETFYHQGGCSTIGLPTPGDLMGIVPLEARRRLERDHGVILL